MADRKPVGSDEIREWARSTDWKDEKGRPVGERGRISTTLVTAYEKKHRSRQYVPGYRPEVQGNASAAKNSASKEVATSPAPAKNSTAKAKQAEPVRVESQRMPAQTVNVNGGGQVNAQIMETVADVIASLTAAKSVSGSDTPVMGAVYFLV